MTYSHVQTFISILIRDARVFQKHIFNRFIDACVWTSLVLFVAQYILPHLGINQSFGTFVMLGNIAAWGMLEVGTNVSTLLADLTGSQSTTYYLTLPIPQSWIFLRIGLMDAYKSCISTLPMIPVAKLVLWNHVSLSDIALGKLLLMYILAHLFFGFFGLFLSSITPGHEYLTTIKLRIIFPLWFIGGYQFTWQMLYKTSPVAAYINLANPIIYIMEGLKGAVLTNYQLISYPICIIMTVIFTIIFAFLGTKIFKKRLDCI